MSRDLSKLIAKLLDLVPKSEVNLRAGLESRRTSLLYTAPEAIGLRWKEVAALMYERLGETPPEEWGKACVKLFVGDDPIVDPTIPTNIRARSYQLPYKGGYKGGYDCSFVVAFEFNNAHHDFRVMHKPDGSFEVRENCDNKPWIFRRSNNGFPLRKLLATAKGQRKLMAAIVPKFPELLAEAKVLYEEEQARMRRQDEMYAKRRYAETAAPLMLEALQKMVALLDAGERTEVLCILDIEGRKAMRLAQGHTEANRQEENSNG